MVELWMTNMRFDVFEKIGLTCTSPNAVKFDKLKCLNIDITRKLTTSSHISAVLQCIEHLNHLCIRIPRWDLSNAMDILSNIENCDNLSIQYDDHEISLDFRQRSLKTSDVASLELFEYTGALLILEYPDAEYSQLCSVLLEQQENYHMIHILTTNASHLQVLCDKSIQTVQIAYVEDISEEKGKDKKQEQENKEMEEKMKVASGTFFWWSGYFSANMRKPELANHIPTDVTALELHYNAEDPPVNLLLKLDHLERLRLVGMWIDGHMDQFVQIRAPQATACTNDDHRTTESLPLILLNMLDPGHHWQALHTIQLDLLFIDKLERLRHLLRLPKLRKLSIRFVNMEINMTQAVEYLNELDAKWTFEGQGNEINGKRVKLTFLQIFRIINFLFNQFHSTIDRPSESIW